MSEYTDGDPLGPDAEYGDPAPAIREAPRSRSASRRVIGPFTVRHLVVVNTILVLSVVGLVVATQPIGLPSSAAAVDPRPTFYRLSNGGQGLDIGQVAPELVGTSNDQPVGLKDLDGRPLTLASLRGHPVWITFWATWCPPCQRETPDLRAAYEAHRKDGLVLIAVDVQEEAGVVRDYVTRYGLTYTIGMDVSGAIFRTYKGFGIPTHYFIDRNGVIRDRVFGPLDRAGIEQRLAKILGP